MYAFSRIDRDEKVEYVVALNNSESEAIAAVPTFYPEGTNFERVLGVGPDVLTTGTDGRPRCDRAGLGHRDLQGERAGRRQHGRAQRQRHLSPVG